VARSGEWAKHFSFVNAHSGSFEAESETQKEGPKWVGKPVGNSGFGVMSECITTGTHLDMLKLRAPNKEQFGI